MSRQFIGEYLAELNRLGRVSGSRRESVLREAFKDLLKRYGRQRDLTFVPEYPLTTNRKKPIMVDGALVHSLRVPLGYWEAKDQDDDLDEEIEKKFRAGYPKENIIFEDTREAVLIQNGEHVLRCAVTDEERLAELLDLFFGYEREEIADFRKAVEQFKKDLPSITAALKDLIEKAAKDSKPYAKAEARFLAHAKDTINPSVTVGDVREMLMQHILTEEIFSHVFDQKDFHQQNNVAKELYALERTFFTGGLKHDTLKALAPYYATIKANAALITTHAEKQKFLKVIYESFYKVYNPKAADRLGVVYTPNEIVRFMIDGADWLCREHFGKGLIDEGVEILDPATGTGTFVCELLETFSGHPQKLYRKYKEEIHANEVAILPYYVANLNIEATYYSIANQYAEYENLCFVDTLDNVEGLGKFSGHQEDLFGAVSAENVARIKRQNKRKISVVIGNPPYNANQQNENDNNKNRDYPRIDQRIKATYIAESTAQKTKLYDPFVRFIRWASDRINGEGIVCFIVNRKFIDGKNFDGFRKLVVKEFDEFRVIDLGGDYKEKGVGGGGNVFGIGTGVAILFAIARKRKGASKLGRVHYAAARGATGHEKLAWLSDTSLSALRLASVQPVGEAAWWHDVENTWEALPAVASKNVKSAKLGSMGSAVFEHFGIGISTNRDEWVYSFSEQTLRKKINFFDARVKEAKAGGRDLDNIIKLSRNLLRRFKASKIRDIDSWNQVATVAYRPFACKLLYFSNTYVDELGSFKTTFARDNFGIAFTDPTSQKEWFCLGTSHVPDLHFVGAAAGTIYVCRYRYTSSGERIDNITDWALEQFRAHYGPKVKIEKDAIFHYVYAVLHDPVYRERYALNLKREFPRIPFYPDFARWTAWGEKLMALHIGFESVEPWPLSRVEKIDEKARAAKLKPKPVLKSDHETGIVVLDTETQLTGVPSDAWHYRLGNRTALDWILDQHKEKTPKDPTIREKFNTYRFADYKEKVVDLLGRVTRVSVETVAITEAMKSAKR